MKRSAPTNIAVAVIASTSFVSPILPTDVQIFEPHQALDPIAQEIGVERKSSAATKPIPAELVPFWKTKPFIGGSVGLAALVSVCVVLYFYSRKKALDAEEKSSGKSKLSNSDSESTYDRSTTSGTMISDSTVQRPESTVPRPRSSKPSSSVAQAPVVVEEMEGPEGPKETLLTDESQSLDRTSVTGTATGAGSSNGTPKEKSKDATGGTIISVSIEDAKTYALQEILTNGVTGDQFDIALDSGQTTVVSQDGEEKDVEQLGGIKDVLLQASQARQALALVGEMEEGALIPMRLLEKVKQLRSSVGEEMFGETYPNLVVKLDKLKNLISKTDFEAGVDSCKVKNWTRRGQMIAHRTSSPLRLESRAWPC